MKKDTARRLSDLVPGESAKILETPLHNERLAEIGLIKGQMVTLVKVAPLGDPVMLEVLDSSIIVRRVDLEGVRVS